MRGLGYRALRVGLMCGINYVYYSDTLDQRVINRAPAAVDRSIEVNMLGSRGFDLARQASLGTWRGSWGGSELSGFLPGLLVTYKR